MWIPPVQINEMETEESLKEGLLVLCEGDGGGEEKMRQCQRRD